MVKNMYIPRQLQKSVIAIERKAGDVTMSFQGTGRVSSKFVVSRILSVRYSRSILEILGWASGVSNTKKHQQTNQITVKHPMKIKADSQPRKSVMSPQRGNVSTIPTLSLIHI